MNKTIKVTCWSYVSLGTWKLTFASPDDFEAFVAQYGITTSFAHTLFGKLDLNRLPSSFMSNVLGIQNFQDNEDTEWLFLQKGSSLFIIKRCFASLIRQGIYDTSFGYPRLSSVIMQNADALVFNSAQFEKELREYRCVPANPFDILFKSGFWEAVTKEIIVGKPLRSGGMSVVCLKVDKHHFYLGYFATDGLGHGVLLTPNTYSGVTASKEIDPKVFTRMVLYTRLQLS